MDDDEWKDYDSISGSDPDAFSEDDAPEGDLAPDDSTKPSSKPSKQSTESRRKDLLAYPQLMPYSVETLDEMDDRLDLIVTRLSEAIEGKDWDVAFLWWHRELARWIAMKYPMKRERRVGLVNLYFAISISPGMSARIIETCCAMFMSLSANPARVSRKDVILPWRELFEILKFELFPKGRRTGLTNKAGALLSLTETAQRFFHPSETDAMLEAFLPMMDGHDLNTVIASQSFMCHFLPPTHPQKWLPMLFTLSASFNSATFDDQMLDLFSRLAEIHLDPSKSDPERMEPGYVFGSKEGDDLEDDAGAGGGGTSAGEGERMAVGDNGGDDADEGEIEVEGGGWKGIYKEGGVGIFSDEEYRVLMGIALKSMVADDYDDDDGDDLEGSKHGIGAHSDAKLSEVMEKMKKPSDRIQSLAYIIVYSMSRDSPNAATAAPSGTATPATSVPMTGVVDSNGASSFSSAGSKISGPASFLAGSKSLDSMAQLITNCESLFHPSNPAQSSITTSTFIWALSAVFVKRWKDEEKPTCKTPKSRRLTKEIKREFCLSLRTVALLAMFSKHQSTTALAHACLRYLSFLEPSLILQEVLERAYPSLTGLEETHRTPSVLTALAACSLPLVSREVYYLGARNLVPLLEACLPAIDLNDPTKSISATWLISNLVQFVQLSDLTDFEPSESDNPSPWMTSNTPPLHIEFDPETTEAEPPLSIVEENQALRYSTGSIGSWLTAYIERVLQLFENLPDQGGKSLKTGGKTEEATNGMVQKSTALIFTHLSEPLFDQALNQIFDYAKTTAKPSIVNVMAQLVSSLAKVDFAKTYALFFPLCEQKIRSELEAGASSVGTTSASLPQSSDTTLHAYLAILSGMLNYTDSAVLESKEKLVSLMSFVQEKAQNQQAWSISARMIGRILTRLTTAWTEDARFVNSDEWNSEHFKQNSHLYWGKVYLAKDCNIDWHLPSLADLEFVSELLEKLVVPTLSALETELPTNQAPKKEWTIRFCKQMSFLRHALDGLHSYYLEDADSKKGGKELSDKGPCPTEFQSALSAFKAGFILTDPSDPRHQSFAALRERIGKFLVRGATYLRSEGSDDSTDAVVSLVTTISTFMLNQGVDDKSYDSKKKHYDLLTKALRVFPRQKVLPRKIWVARAELYSCSRSRSAGWSRKRSSLDDELIFRMLGFALSSYVRIRRHAQAHLDVIAHVYDGTKMLVHDQLMASLTKGTDPDQMKGALYTLRAKGFSSFSLSDPRIFPSFIMKVLATQDQEKASIQTLIAKIAEENIIRMAEPSTLRSMVSNERLDAARKAAVPRRRSHTSTEKVLRELRSSVESRTVQKDEAFDQLVSDLLALVESPTTHWRYNVFASRYLRALIRRDRPQDPRIAAFFMSKAIDDLPQLRHYSELSLIKILHLIKLRTLCDGSEERILLEKPTNHLKRTISTQTPNFPSEFLATFKVPITYDDTTTVLHDKSQSGWLAWDKEITGFVQAPWDAEPFEWDPESKAGMDAIRKHVEDPAWWEKLIDRYAQEDSRTYLSGDSISFIKSLCQIYSSLPFKMTRGRLDAMLADPDYSRHKQRAFAEVLSGLVRGSKHWPGKERKEFWDWLTPVLPKIHQAVKPDTLSLWAMFFDFNFYKRDPRRMQPMLDWVIDTALACDVTSSSAFESTKSLTWLSCLMRCMTWKFDAWSQSFIGPFFDSLGLSDFADVRNLLAENLHRFQKIQWRVSNQSPLAFVMDCESPEKDVMGLRRASDRLYIEKIVKDLPVWREERPSGPMGPSSTYDKHASALCKYFVKAFADLNGAAAFSSILPLLPEVFQMRELNDSPDLQKASAGVLAFVANITPPSELTNPLISNLLNTLRGHKSWHIRLHVLPVLATLFFRGLPLIDDNVKQNIVETLCECLLDANREVCEVSATVLAAILRCSQRKMILTLKARFLHILRTTPIPKRRFESGESDPAYIVAVDKKHSAVLGIGSIIEAFPYSVPKYVPELLTELSLHASDPIPISTTVRRIAASFKASHTDTWRTDAKAFSEDQLASFQDVLSGTSYYA